MPGSPYENGRVDALPSPGVETRSPVRSLRWHTGTIDNIVCSPFSPNPGSCVSGNPTIRPRWLPCYRYLVDSNLHPSKPVSGRTLRYLLFLLWVGKVLMTHLRGNSYRGPAKYRVTDNQLFCDEVTVGEQTLTSSCLKIHCLMHYSVVSSLNPANR